MRHRKKSAIDETQIDQGIGQGHPAQRCALAQKRGHHQGKQQEQRRNLGPWGIVDQTGKAACILFIIIPIIYVGEEFRRQLGALYQGQRQWRHLIVNLGQILERSYGLTGVVQNLESAADIDAIIEHHGAGKPNLVGDLAFIGATHINESAPFNGKQFFPLHHRQTLLPKWHRCIAIDTDQDHVAIHQSIAGFAVGTGVVIHTHQQLPEPIVSHEGKTEFQGCHIAKSDIQPRHQAIVNHVLPGLGFEQAQSASVGIGAGDIIGIGQIDPGNPACRIADAPGHGPTADGGTGHAVHVSADTETISHVLVFELIWKSFCRQEVTTDTLIGLPIIQNFYTSKRAVQIHTDQHIDGCAITNFFRWQIRCLE